MAAYTLSQQSPNNTYNGNAAAQHAARCVPVARPVRLRRGRARALPALHQTQAGTRAADELRPRAVRQGQKTYLGAVFRNGQDFLGQWSWDEVCAMLAQHDTHAVELLSNTFEACRARLPALREGVYTRLRAFAEEQLV